MSECVDPPKANTASNQYANDEIDDSYYEKLEKEELIEIIKVIESDLFKQRAENMRLKKQIKEMEDKSILNKKVFSFDVFNENIECK